MIQANELRIGNWVSLDLNHSDKSEFPIELPDLNLIATDKHRNYNPIPLTEEWLMKFGFDKIVGWDDFTFFRKRYVDIDVNNNGYYFYKPKIQYVHQLQNLYFALTGEELTLK